MLGKFSSASSAISALKLYSNAEIAEAAEKSKGNASYLRPFDSQAFPESP